MGDIVIDGDLTIGPESSLVIYSPSRVLLEGDRLGAGVDPSRCEINVEGRFEVHSGVIKRWNGFEESTDFEQSKPVVFESLPGQTWTGILPSEAAELRLDEADLRNSDYGLVEPGTKLAALGVHVATVILEEDAPPAAADTFALLTSYPNPFESETTLRYVLAEDSDVRLAIYSSIGQQVRVLVDEYQFAGPQEITWFAAADDGQRVGSGVYLYQLDVPGKFTGRDKMLLLKSGYARLSPIDKALKAHRARWADIRSELDETAYGFTAHAGDSHPAFLLGVASVGLRVSAQYASSQRGLGRQLASTRARLLVFQPSSREMRTFDALVEDISADDRAVERRIEMVTQISDLLRRVIGQNENSQGPVAQTVYFELGVWIQSLRAAAVAARECETSLAEVVEVADYGDTGRQFADYLRYVGAGDAIVVSIDRLANALEKQPVDDGGIGALLVQLDTIGRSVNEGAGDREQR